MCACFALVSTILVHKTNCAKFLSKTLIFIFYKNIMRVILGFVVLTILYLIDLLNFDSVNVRQINYTIYIIYSSI